MKTFKVGDLVKLTSVALKDPTFTIFDYEKAVATIKQFISPQVVELDWIAGPPPKPLRTRWNIGWLESADPYKLELETAEKKWVNYFAANRG